MERIVVASKLCSRCGERKLINAFHPRRKFAVEDLDKFDNPASYCSRCKICDAEVRREWSAKNPERQQEAWRRYDEQRRQDADVRGARRAYWRERWRKEHPNPRGSIAPGQKRVMVPADPFCSWLATEVGGHVSSNSLAATLGISATLVRTVLDGTRTRVSLDVIDRAVTNYGRPDLLDTLAPIPARLMDR